MSEPEVTKPTGVWGDGSPRPRGVPGSRPPRPARRRGRGEQPKVPSAQFTGYYRKPVIDAPVWQAPDVPGYLFLGGLAGAS